MYIAQRKIPAPGDIVRTPYYTDGWSDTRWIVIETYPHGMLCRNITKSGVIGAKTRGIGYGQRYKLNSESKEENEE